MNIHNNPIQIVCRIGIHAFRCKRAVFELIKKNTKQISMFLSNIIDWLEKYMTCGRGSRYFFVRRIKKSRPTII